MLLFKSILFIKDTVIFYHEQNIAYMFETRFKPPEMSFLMAVSGSASL